MLLECKIRFDTIKVTKPQEAELNHGDYVIVTFGCYLDVET